MPIDPADAQLSTGGGGGGGGASVLCPSELRLRLGWGAGGAYSPASNPVTARHCYPQSLCEVWGGHWPGSRSVALLRLPLPPSARPVPAFLEP